MQKMASSSDLQRFIWAPFLLMFRCLLTNALSFFAVDIFGSVIEAILAHVEMMSYNVTVQIKAEKLIEIGRNMIRVFSNVLIFLLLLEAKKFFSLGFIFRRPCPLSIR